MAKKICAIVSLSIIGVLIITTIIMANININYGINFKAPVYVYVNNTEVSLTEQNKIVEYINGASNENCLNALFTGKLNNQAKVVNTGSKKLSTTKGYSVEFYYDEPQILMESNKKYTDENGKSYTYERLIFEITENNGEAEYKVYVIPNSEERNVYSHYYILNADFTDLYNYLVTTL